jgi:hypothetical protein
MLFLGMDYSVKGKRLMQAIKIIEKNIQTGIFQFMIPFSLKEGSEASLYSYLEKSHFQLFELKNLDQENQFYGTYHIKHRQLEKFFLPFTNKLLFPQQDDIKGFRRYSKPLNEKVLLRCHNTHIPFLLHSIDVTLCPFELAFLTIRTEIKDQTLSDSIEFVSIIKSMEHVVLELQGTVYWTFSSFTFDFLVPGFMKFINQAILNGMVFEPFPSTDFGGMYVQSLLSFSENETIDTVDVYRIGNLNGLDSDGKPYVQANNLDYIKKCVEKNSYDCWLPDRGYFLTDSTFSCMTNEDEMSVTDLVVQMYGEIYYSLLIQVFHKMVFLKIVKLYAAINVENDTKEVGKLIYVINSFTSNYFFLISPSQTKGKELFNLIRKSCDIDYFYNITKEVLFTLFKYEENTVTKKDSSLLLILTVYTVICGIFSMNLFTHDLVGNIPWSHLNDYNPFETFAVFVVFSGILVAWILLIQSLYQAYVKRKNKKKWVQQTVIISKKPNK